MALQNQPRIYSGGAVEVSTQPLVNIYAQNLQRKQAREEALDAYEMNRMNRMNEQGVRDIDRPGLDQKVLDMKMYYQANKDRIRKGGTPEAYNYEKMFRDTLGGVAKSKDATKRGIDAYKLVGDRRKLGRNTPDEMLNEYQRMEETPVWDETYEPIDNMKWNTQTNAKFDQKKYLDMFKGVQRTPGSPRYEEIPGDKYGRNKFIDESYDDNAKAQIGHIVDTQFDTDDGLLNITQAAVEDPIRRGQVEKLFTQEYGTAPQSMKDYAKGITLQMLQPKVTGKPKYEPLFEERQKLLQGYKQQNIATYQWYKAQDRANQDYFIEAIYEDNLDEAAKNGGFFNPSPTVKNKLGFAGKVPAKDFRIRPTDQYIGFDDGTGNIQWISPNTYKAQVRDEFTAKGTEPQVKKATVTQPKRKKINW